ASAAMSTPRGMAFDPSGNLAVADSGYHRIVQFSVICPATTTSTTPAFTQPPNQVCAASYWNSTINIVAGYTRSPSSALTRLYNPQDVTFDGYRYMYVADYSNNRVLRYNPGSVRASTGKIIAGFTTAGGSGFNQLNGPTAIYLDSNRTLYILDNLNYRVQKWINGQPIGFTVAGGRGSGATLDKISTSQGLYVDDQSRVYVSEIGNDRVTRWDNTTIGVIVAGNGTAGNALSQLRDPWGIYIDSTYSVFIVDRGSSSGQTMAGTSGVAGSLSTQFNLPTSITFDQYSNMYIMDSGNDRIQRWSPGSLSGVTVVAATSLYNPRSLAIDPLGNLVVADCSNHRVVSFAVICCATTLAIATTISGASTTASGTTISGASTSVSGTTISGASTTVSGTTISGAPTTGSGTTISGASTTGLGTTWSGGSTTGSGTVVSSSGTTTLGSTVSGGSTINTLTSGPYNGGGEGSSITIGVIAAAAVGGVLAIAALVALVYRGSSIVRWFKPGVSSPVTAAQHTKKVTISTASGERLTILENTVNSRLASVGSKPCNSAATGPSPTSFNTYLSNAATPKSPSTMQVGHRIYNIHFIR
ncbi:unnamed protein product, partial [Rotaria magnacalcarata]